MREVLEKFNHLITTDVGMLGELESPTCTVKLIHHAPDWRLGNLVSRIKLDSCIYVGNLARFPMGFGAPSELKLVRVRNYSLNFSRVPIWARGIQNFSFHLTASKNLLEDSARPITKIATSILLEAYPIAGAWEKNALSILGENYPFYIHSQDPISMSVELKVLLSNDLEKNKEIAASVIKNSRFISCPIAHTNQWLSLFSELNSREVL
jgi:hypothetical protein